jgi:hypothetical protein
MGNYRENSMACVHVDFVQALLPEFSKKSNACILSQKSKQTLYEISATRSVLFLICTHGHNKRAPSSAKKGSYKKVITFSINHSLIPIGATWFGRTTAVILAAVIACTLVTIVSFFQNLDVKIPYEGACVEASNLSIIENCTQITNGTFVGLAAASANTIKDLVMSNMYPRYCNNPHIQQL